MGFTLIEVLVAVVILSVGIVSVLRAFSTSLTALVESRTTLGACLAIRERLSDIQAAAGGEAGGSAVTSLGGPFRTDSGFVGVVRVVAIRDGRPASVRGRPAVALYEVTVTVWKEGSDERHSASTYVSTRDVPATPK